MLENPVHRPVKKVPGARRARNRSFDLAQDRLSRGVLRQYVGATPLGAGMIPAAIERNYPKRLLRAGWWQMGLFQRPVNPDPTKTLNYAGPWSTSRKSFSHRGDSSVTSLTVSFGLHGANHSSTWSGAQHR